MSDRWENHHVGRKIIFNIANLGVLAIGMGIMAVGFLSKDNDSEFMSGELNRQLRSVSFTVIAFGGGVVAVSILGMISVNCDIRLLSLIYKLALAISGCLLILLGTATLVMVAVLGITLRQEMVDMMKDEKKRLTMDEIETSNKCCGVDGHMDLYDNKPKYPKSCCPLKILCLKIVAYKTRCDHVWTNRRDEMLYYAGFAFLIVGIYCIVLAILVYWAETRRYRYR